MVVSPYAELMARVSESYRHHAPDCFCGLTPACGRERHRIATGMLENEQAQLFAAYHHEDYIARRPAFARAQAHFAHIPNSYLYRWIGMKLGTIASRCYGCGEARSPRAEGRFCKACAIRQQAAWHEGLDAQRARDLLWYRYQRREEPEV